LELKEALSRAQGAGKFNTDQDRLAALDRSIKEARSLLESSTLTKPDHATSTYYPLAAAGVAALAVLTTLLAAAWTISGPRQQRSWQTSFVAGPLLGGLGVLVLFILTMRNPWDMTVVTSYSTWISIAAALGLGLATAAARSGSEKGR
jgi:hypothetical protein